jgi:hypothetical protein
MQASRQTAESNPNHRGTAALPGTRPGGDVTGILGLSRIQRKMPRSEALNGDVPPISRNRAAADTFNSEQVDEGRVNSALGETYL